VVLNEIERSAKRQLIERNRQSKQIRTQLTHWDQFALKEMDAVEFRSLVDETTRQYIHHMDSPLTGENKLIFRDKNMLRLMLVLRAWQFGQSVESLVSGRTFKVLILIDYIKLRSTRIRRPTQKRCFDSLLV
jgi:hypothetical protein